MNATPHARRWPLFLIAAPAAVAVWSGWVGLGTMCGFGLVTPFPGIVSWHLNTAITLPVGVEAYGAYALGAWLTPGTPDRARTFARSSALGALALGMLGQVVYHLLAAAHAARAPWPVVVLVSCLPVVTLGFGAALTHLLRVPAGQADAGQSAAQEPGAAIGVVAEPAEEGGLHDVAGQADDDTGAAGSAEPPEVPRDAEHAAMMALRATHAAGNVLSGRQVEARFGVSRSTATRLRKSVLGEPQVSYGHDDEANAARAAAEPLGDAAREPVPA